MSLLAALVACASGCAHWVSVPSYGPQREVARRLYGSPMVQEDSSSDVSAGFGTYGESYQGRRYGSSYRVGGLSGNGSSVKRTHCVQQAQIDYVQPVDYQPHVVGRMLDAAGIVGLGAFGAGVVGFAHAKYSDDEQFYEMDPSFFAKPSQPSVAYAIGGAALIGAAAWLVYSLGSLPKGPAPQTAPTERAWTETTYVEATGCGLVPGDRVGQAGAR